MFKTSKGIKLNSDINGAYNILKKAFPKAFADGIEGVCVHPYSLSWYYKKKQRKSHEKHEKELKDKSVLPVFICNTL